MQENNFEKQVKEKAGDLKLQPSAEVWQKLSVALAKNKTDRRLTAFLCLFLLFIGSAIFILSRQGSSPVNNGAAKTIGPKSDVANGADKKNQLAPATTEVSKPAVATIDPITARSNGKDPEIRPKAQPSAGKAKSTQGFPGGKPAHPNLAPGSQAPGDHNVQQLSDITGANKSELAGAIEQPVKAHDPEDGQAATELQPGVADEPSPQQQQPAAIPKAEQIEPAKYLPANQKQVNQKNSWKFGVTISAGWSGTNASYLGITGDASKDLYSSPAPATGGNAGGGQSTYHSPSEVKTGAGFILGGFLQKRISAHVSFLTGINYKMYSSSIMTGNRVDSSNNLNNYATYYRTGSSNQYKNHFHFVEIPLTMRYSPGKGNKSVNLAAGISIARLIASDALQFDTASGSYYQNNSLFNKTQLFASLSVLFPIWGKSENPLLVGPELNVSVNRIAASGLFQSSRYSYFGITLQKGFGK